MWAKYTDSFDHVGVVGTFVLPNWRQVHRLLRPRRRRGYLCST
jgi:hypothetical protein